MAENRRRSSSPDSLFVSPDPHYNNTHPAQRHTPLVPPPTANRTRYPGDGLDYRRPVSTASAAGMGNNAVIDLTEEDDSRSAAEVADLFSAEVMTPEPGPSRTRQRLPNFQSRNIIDVESDVEREEREASRGGPSAHHTRRSSPHRHPNYFSSTRHSHRPAMDRNPSDHTAAPLPRILPTTWAFASAQRSITPHPTGNATQRNNPIDLTADEDDDVVFTGIAPRVPSQLNLGRPEATAGTGTRSVRDAGVGVGDVGGGVAGGMFNQLYRVMTGAAPAGVRHRAVDAPMPAQGALLIGMAMDYERMGFPMGQDALPPTPKYEPPEKAPAGFTRSPGENEEVVCPNCGDELCMGDNDIKQQVWVVKGCGHVSR